MRAIDVAIIFVSMLVVMSLGEHVGQNSKERELVVAAEKCWADGRRAVYVRVDGEYRIRCEP